MLTYFQEEHDKKNIFSVAFYNLENLYDIENDPIVNDDEFTPQGEKHWNERKYKNKLEHSAEVLSQIGSKHSSIPPILIGIAEVENENVLKDLLKNRWLHSFNYDFVHFDSPDSRGIEVAMLYNKDYFDVISADRKTLFLYEENGERDYTRDILIVEGRFLGEHFFILINHWPSRREGLEISEPKRLKAAELVAEIVNSLKYVHVEAKYIVMGDFNDDPMCKSMKHLVHTTDLYNPMESLKSKRKGTLYSQKHWYLFDQILFSKNIFNQEPGKLFLRDVDVYAPHFIRTWKGYKKNTPFRTFSGRKYLGGFSDHFPVVAYLERIL